MLVFFRGRGTWWINTHDGVKFALNYRSEERIVLDEFFNGPSESEQLALRLIFGVFRLSDNDQAIFKYTKNLEHVTLLHPCDHRDSYFLKMVNAGKLRLKDYDQCFFSIKKVKQEGSLKIIEAQYCLTLIDELEPAPQSEHPETQAFDTQNPNQTNDLKALNKASEYFWSRVKKSDRSTWPLTAEVENYLIGEGLSARSAAAGAAIIRPNWAPPGRKPK